MSDLKATLAGFADPRLADAACVGKAPLFDARGPKESAYNYRHRAAEARAYCQACRVRAACNTVAGEIARTSRTGMWAGVQRGEGT